MTAAEKEDLGYMTVGELRALMKDLPDDMPIILDVVSGEDDSVCAFGDDGAVDEQENGEKAFFLTGYAAEGEGGG